MSRYPARSYHSREPKYRRNGKIRAREVRVLDEEKRQLGIMSLTEALRLAQGKGLDLIEIVPTADPPVCRIVDYGKFQYEESKKSKDSRQTAGRMKEIQLTPLIDSHDFATKLSHAVGFLCEDMKVRVKLRFRGRQQAHKEFGFEVVNRFVKAAAAYGQPDAPPKMLGDRDLNVIISPLPRERRAKPPRSAEPEPTAKSEPAPAADQQPAERKTA